MCFNATLSDSISSMIDSFSSISCDLWSTAFNALFSLDAQLDLFFAYSAAISNSKVLFNKAILSVSRKQTLLVLCLLLIVDLLLVADS